MSTLAICIPTYSRSALLAELLDSIVAQNKPDLEVIVSDDASPDDTLKVIEGYFGKIPKLVYIRQPANIGLDRNILSVIAAATTDYVWLMGDDDVVKEGGVARVLGALTSWPRVAGLTLGVVDFDSAMRVPVGARQTPSTRRIEGLDEVFAGLVDLLGFMSALVISRRGWLGVAADPKTDEFQNYYVQVYIIGRVLQTNPSWGVVQYTCVRFRTDNDKFKHKLGWVERLRIDAYAYNQVADAFFLGGSATHWMIRSKVFATHVISRVNNYKSGSDRDGGLWDALLLLFRNYGDMRLYWTWALPTLLAPKCLVLSAKTAYRRFSSRSGASPARTMRSAP